MWFRSIKKPKTVYITEEEREMCYKMIDAFAELYEMEDEEKTTLQKRRL